MKIVVLDRDGVINEDRHDYVKNLDEWVWLPGSLRAIVSLSQAGWRVYVMTNQAGVGKGSVPLVQLLAMHQHLQQQVQQAGGQLDAVMFCAHTDADACDCRKPKPGMLLDLRERLGLANLHDVAVVGDSLRDMQAAQAAGCSMHLVRTGHGEKTMLHPELPAGTKVYRDLADFSQQWLKAD